MKTSIDYLKFRTRSSPFDVLEALRPAFGSAASLVELGDCVKGKDGWEHRRHLRIAGDVSIGAIDYGGESQREWVRVDIPGSGCAWIQDWAKVVGLLDVLKEPALKRVDIALTTYDGSISHEVVIAAHEARQFSSGGRHPHRRVITSSDARAGRTVYVGRREGSKFFRAYEKGHERLQKHVPAWMHSGVTQLEFDGHGLANVEDVYRVEVEFKDEDGKVMPWTMLTNPDSYFVGAYPFCAALLPGAPERKVQTMPDFGPRMALLAQLEHARRAYGSILRTAIDAFDGDRDLVLSMITSDKPSERLISAGVLTVVHQG
jgi:phage replication initiation protein